MAKNQKNQGFAAIRDVVSSSRFRESRIHGLYQVIADLLKTSKTKIREKMNIKTDCISWKLLQTVVTFGLVVFAWIFFRADTITDALRFIKRIIVKPTPWLLFNGGIYKLGLDRAEMNILVFALIILLLVDLIKYNKKQTIDAFLFEQNTWFEWLVIHNSLYIFNFDWRLML